MVVSACRAAGRTALRALAPVSLIAVLGVVGYLAWPTVYATNAENAGPATLDALSAGLGNQDTAPAATPTEVGTVTTSADQLETADQTAPGQAETPDQDKDPDQNWNAENADPTTRGNAEQAAPSASTSGGTATAPPSSVCFELILRDDFDGPLGPAWEVYDSLGTHSRHAVRKPEAITIVDGKLVITAANGPDGFAASGGMRHLVSQRYGKYSFSVRTDPDPTNATSGVILTWPVSNSQPIDGENNMYETLRVPGDRSQFFSFIHEPFDETANGISQSRFVHRADATQWQQVTMEWTPDFVQIIWTNPATGSTRTRRIEEGPEDLITDAEHFLAIQLDLFKAAFPDDREVKMEVDWVEVYAYCG